MENKKFCKVCKKEFLKPHSVSKNEWIHTKFCSRKCFHSQHKIWLGKKRPEHSKIMKSLYSKGIMKPIIMMDENNPSWKGDRASYSAIHYWLYNHKVRKGICEDCGITEAKRYEFANISGEYKRDINDYKELCVRCHRYMDGNLPYLNSINNYA